MRFCIAIWTAMLLLATPVFGEGSDGESCKHDGKHDGKHSGKHKCKHKSKKIGFEYDWNISMSDDQLGKEPYTNTGKFIRKISSGHSAAVSFGKEWEEYNLALYYDLTAEKVSDGLLIATVNAELPRSYLSVEVGKGRLHFGGFRDHTSPYLSHHSPFSKYAVMGRVYAPLEGLGELSLMVTNDVKHDEEAHGEGDTRRWHVERQTIAPLFQYKGEFDMVSPLVQFAYYDYGDGWYRSLATTVGVKLKVDKMTMSVDGTLDERKHPTTDDTTTYINVVADLAYRHGMVTMNLEASKFMDWDNRKKSAGNKKPVKEMDDKPEGFDKLKDKDKKTNPYTIAQTYHKGDWMKYGNNMTAVAARLDIHCIENKFVPYVYWGMKHHQIEGDEKDQQSHTVAVGIWGAI